MQIVMSPQELHRRVCAEVYELALCVAKSLLLLEVNTIWRDYPAPRDLMPDLEF